jgi:hypothetical protein
VGIDLADNRPEHPFRTSAQDIGLIGRMPGHQP